MQRYYDDVMFLHDYMRRHHFYKVAYRAMSLSHQSKGQHASENRWFSSKKQHWISEKKVHDL